MPCKKSDCSGCRNNFYNGNNSLGVSECWSLKTAKKIVRYQIGTNTPMWIREAYLKMKLPSCYHSSGYVYLNAVPDYAKTAKEREEYHKREAARNASTVPTEPL